MVKIFQIDRFGSLRNQMQIGHQDIAHFFISQGGIPFNLLLLQSLQIMNRLDSQLGQCFDELGFFPSELPDRIMQRIKLIQCIEYIFCLVQESPSRRKQTQGNPLRRFQNRKRRRFQGIYG